LIGSWTVALVALLLLAGPAGAAAEGPPNGADPPPGYANAFTVKGSHGYELTGFASIGDKGKGWVFLAVHDHSSVVTYGVPATVTADPLSAATIEADLGALGRISFALVPTGRQENVRIGCVGKKHVRVEAARYEGKVEFHGEEGYTDVSRTSADVDYDIYRRMLCSELDFHDGTSYPRGARLEIKREVPDQLRLRAAATKPNRIGRTLFSAGIVERRAGIVITREVGTLGGNGAFGFDSKLRMATLRPPAPFAGQATFDRSARPANRWTGNLSVDFPGRSDVALTGPGLAVDLFHPGP
jgi:hypothetical protein